MLMISEETVHLFCFVITVHTMFAPVNKNSHERLSCSGSPSFHPSYFAVRISTAIRSVCSSPVFPGKMTYGVFGNLDSSPVCHTGIPGWI